MLPPLWRAAARVLAAAWLVAATPGAAFADAPAAAAPRAEVPIAIDEAARRFRAHGFDLLIADARIRSAEGDRLAARALANPVVSPVVGRSFDYHPIACSGCSATTLGVSLGEPSAISDLLSGKRGLRSRVAEHVVRLAELGRRDTERVLLADVKTQVVILAGAQAQLDLARTVRDSLRRTVELNQLKYPGTIDEGQLARVQRESLEAENVVDRSALAVLDASLTLGFLLGDRDAQPTRYAAAADVLPFRVPTRLADATPEALTRRAWTSRADLQQADVEVGRARAAIDLASRERVPPIGWTLAYLQTGTGALAIQPPTVTIGISVPLPLLYRREGEIARARGERDAASVLRERLAAQVSLEVSSRFAEMATYRSVVERTERSLLDRARVARDVTELQYRAGSATLIDYLDAQRGFVASTGAYVDALVSYWTAVFYLEAAVGEELT